jgi:O-antigen ligase
MVFVLFLLYITGFGIYFFTTYEIRTKKIEKICLQTNIDPIDMLIYVKTDHSNGIDFSKPIKPDVVEEGLVFDVHDLNPTGYRIYIGKSYDFAEIKNLKLVNGSGIEDVSQKDLVNEWIYVKEGDNIRTQFSNEANGFFEYKRSYVSLLKFICCLLLGFITSFGATLLALYAWGPGIQTHFSRDKLKQASVAVFLISIFLPHPLFNVAFILSFAMLLYKAELKGLLKNPVAILLIIYFLVFILNNLCFSESFSKKRLETYIPLLLLPFYFSIAPKENYLRYLPMAAFMIGLLLILLSLVDTYICGHLSYFSFDGFTKYVHPVYFSYLILFALIYIELDTANEYNKRVYIPVLMAVLLFSSSKLIIILTLIFYLIRFLRKKPAYAIGLAALFIMGILIIEPIKKRFAELSDMGSLSVLKEDALKEKDRRLNAFTLRLIIWQQTLRSVSGAKEIIVGNGVDQASDKKLESSFQKRGLNMRHSHYDPHNQFLSTFFHMGLGGLSILVFLCLYILYVGFKCKDQLVIYTALLFIFAMITESVLERVVGIYFFASIMILLQNRMTYKL